MAHKSCESMRSRAFTKGRAAFDSDEEYRLALNGELDGVYEDFSYEANEDPDDGEDGGEDAGDLEDLMDEEAVRIELERFEERIGEAHFLEVLEQFMKVCSGRGEPPYLPFGPVRDVEHLALFCHGSEALRLRYGAYGLEADRLEGDEVVKTWRRLDGIGVLNGWDDVLAELAEEAEEAARSDFFGDVLPGVLGDRKRGAEFLDFVVGGGDAEAAAKVRHFQVLERLWLVHDRSGFHLLEHLGEPGQMQVPATWDEDEFLEGLRSVAWDDPDAQECMLGGGDVEDAWEHLDDAWHDEDEDGLVADSVGKFLADIEDAKRDPLTGPVMRNAAVCGEGAVVTGREEMKMVWGRGCPDMAQLTFSYDDGEESTFDVPLAFLRWWEFCRERGW